jgi:DNA-binding protein HU-beta
MTKNELVAAVAQKTGLGRLEAAAAVETAFELIAAALRDGNEVKIVGFGSFRVVARAPRPGRNPRTGAAVTVPAARRPRFVPAKALKDAVNRPS